MDNIVQFRLQVTDRADHVMAERRKAAVVVWLDIDWFNHACEWDLNISAHDWVAVRAWYVSLLSSSYRGLNIRM